MERSLESIRSARPTVIRETFDGTSEEQIRRQGILDGDVSSDGSGAWRRSVHPTALRESLGLSADEFAEALNVPASLVRDWDSGRLLPDAASKSLLAAVSQDSETVFRLIAGRAA